MPLEVWVFRFAAYPAKCLDSRWATYGVNRVHDVGEMCLGCTRLARALERRDVFCSAKYSNDLHRAVVGLAGLNPEPSSGEAGGPNRGVAREVLNETF